MGGLRKNLSPFQQTECSVTTIAQQVSSVKKNYTLIFWTDFSFDQNSLLIQVTIPDNADANKQLESGLKIIVEIDPATSKAKLPSQNLISLPARVGQQNGWAAYWSRVRCPRKEAAPNQKFSHRPTRRRKSRKCRCQPSALGVLCHRRKPVPRWMGNFPPGSPSKRILQCHRKNSASIFDHIS